MQEVEKFFLAVQDNDLDIVNRMLEHEPLLVTAVDEDSASPLHIAATEGHIIVAEMLIAYGADIDLRDAWGRTPLMVGIYAEPLVEHEPMVKLLLSKGANVNLSDNDGHTPLHMASFGEPKLVALLLMHGANVNAKDNKGMTPLHMAVLYPEVKTVEALLRHKDIETDARNQEGLTPLDIASQKGWSTIVNLIKAQ